MLRPAFVLTQLIIMLHIISNGSLQAHYIDQKCTNRLNHYREVRKKYYNGASCYLPGLRSKARQWSQVVRYFALLFRHLDRPQTTSKGRRHPRHHHLPNLSL
jgi:hypothetical protein